MVTQFGALQRTSDNSSGISDGSDFSWPAFTAPVGLFVAMYFDRCVAGKQVSGQHVLEQEQNVIVSSFADPQFLGLLLTWLKTGLNWRCDEGYRLRLCHLSQTQRDLERASEMSWSSASYLQMMIQVESPALVQGHSTGLKVIVSWPLVPPAAKLRSLLS